jgi:hypothetical protein
MDHFWTLAVYDNPRKCESHTFSMAPTRLKMHRFDQFIRGPGLGLGSGLGLGLAPGLGLGNGLGPGLGVGLGLGLGLGLDRGVGRGVWLAIGV